MSHPPFDRILVTGGTGFIGRYVVNMLVRDGFRPLVTALARRAFENNEYLHEVDIVNLDLTDSTKTNELIESYRPHGVVHLAGATGHNDATGEICHAVNFIGTVNLLKALERCSVRRVIILGSASEYGKQILPFREDMTARPVSHYGISKAKSTEAALEMNAATGFPVTILRVFSAFGYGQPAKMFLSQLINHALINQHFKMSDGLQKRDYVYAGEVAAAIKGSLFTENSIGRIFNIASGRGTVLKELAETVWDVCGADRSLLEIGSIEKTGDDGFDTEADISLADRILGWRPLNSILPTEGKNFALPEMIRQMKSRAHLVRR